MATTGAEPSGTDRGLCIVATPRVHQGTDILVTNPSTLSCSTHSSHAHTEGLLEKSDALLEAEERNGARERRHMTQSLSRKI